MLFNISLLFIHNLLPDANFEAHNKNNNLKRASCCWSCVFVYKVQIHKWKVHGGRKSFETFLKSSLEREVCKSFSFPVLLRVLSTFDVGRSWTISLCWLSSILIFSVTKMSIQLKNNFVLPVEQFWKMVFLFVPLQVCFSLFLSYKMFFSPILSFKINFSLTLSFKYD